MKRKTLPLLYGFHLILSGICSAAPDISSVKPDLILPKMEYGKAAPGKRVQQTHPNWQETEVYHILYLPTDWKPDGKYPVIVEYAGNGPYKNKFGDISTGHPEGSKMGYGLSAGKGYIWVCIPYLSNDGSKNVTQWWGNRPKSDPGPTLEYAKTTIPWICNRYGGDSSKVFLCGFSRGAIACNFLGLHDDEIAKLWCAFIPYSHYDGVRNWGYPGADKASAISRLKRLNGRPQFITHEGNGVAATKSFVKASGISGNFIFKPTGFRNHNDAWLLRPTPLREEIREWMQQIVND